MGHIEKNEDTILKASTVCKLCGLIPFEVFQERRNKAERSLELKARKLFKQIKEGVLFAYELRHFTPDNSRLLGILVSDTKYPLEEVAREFLEQDVDYDVDEYVRYNLHTPEECAELDEELDADTICEFCDGCEAGLELLEFEPFEPKDLIYRLLWGETATWVFSKGKFTRLEDWHPLVAMALRLTQIFGKD